MLAQMLVGFASLNQVLVAMAIPIGMYLAFSLIVRPTKVDLHFSRTLSQERLYVGMPVKVTVRVKNRGVRLENLLLEDLLPPGLMIEAGSIRHLVNLEAGQEFSWQVTLCGNRGYYLFGTVRAEIGGPLGIAPAIHEYQAPGQLFILPPVLKLKGISIRPRNTRVYSGEIPARSGGLGIDFYGVRPYQAGDPPNRINWMASARYPQALYSNEFEQERVADVGIILDGRERSNTIASNISIFEYSVQAAAALSSTFINQGNRVSLLNYGKYLQWTFPGYGKIQLERILRALAGVAPGRSLIFEYLHYLPTRMFPPQSQLVLISPLTPDDLEVLQQIRGCGYKVLVISPDPVKYELQQLPDQESAQMAARILTLERKLLLQKLEQGGIRVVNWDVDQPFDQVVGRLSRVPSEMHLMEFGW
jgi:uncharacterized protein (DUF58 family)